MRGQPAEARRVEGEVRRARIQEQEATARDDERPTAGRVGGRRGRRGNARRQGRQCHLSDVWRHARVGEGPQERVSVQSSRWRAEQLRFGVA